MTRNEHAKAILAAIKAAEEDGMQIGITVERDELRTWKISSDFYSTGIIDGDPGVILVDDGNWNNSEVEYDDE